MDCFPHYHVRLQQPPELPDSPVPRLYGPLVPVIVGQVTVFFLRFASNFFYFVFSFPKHDVLHNGYYSEYLTSFISPA